MNAFKRNYIEVYAIFKRYIKYYGGAKALWLSPYLHFSIIVVIITSYYWSHQAWWEQSISLLPNLLGFSLGGFAIFLGFGDEKFKSFLSEKVEGVSTEPYLRLCATFVHFIFIQFIALIYAIVVQGLMFHTHVVDSFRNIIAIGNLFFFAVGYLLFIYSLTSMLATVMAIFRFARIYVVFQQGQDK